MPNMQLNLPSYFINCIGFDHAGYAAAAVNTTTITSPMVPTNNRHFCTPHLMLTRQDTMMVITGCHNDHSITNNNKYTTPDMSLHLHSALFLFRLPEILRLFSFLASRQSEQNIFATRRYLHLTASWIRACWPENRSSIAACNFHALSHKWFSKYRTKIVPDLVAIQTIRKHLLCLIIEQAVWPFGDLYGNTSSLVVASERL